MIINIILIIAAFLFMEGVAWFTHKYIMHGLLWTWHKSHHSKRNGIFERNDLFAFVFSVPAIILIYFGFNYPAFNWLLFVGIGITLYGVFYFVFHDIIVHRRVPIKFKARSRYMKRIMNAHYVHHRTHTKHGAQSFGFLYSSKKYEKTR